MALNATGLPGDPGTPNQFMSNTAAQGAFPLIPGGIAGSFIGTGIVDWDGTVKKVGAATGIPLKFDTAGWSARSSTSSQTALIKR
jgi:hypothetical protein